MGNEMEDIRSMIKGIKSQMEEIQKTAEKAEQSRQKLEQQMEQMGLNNEEGKNALTDFFVSLLGGIAQ